MPSSLAPPSQLKSSTQAATHSHSPSHHSRAQLYMLPKLPCPARGITTPVEWEGVHKLSDECWQPLLPAEDGRFRHETSR
eukprot:355993-Chlamydomonas_euryale.AAC.9